MNIVADESVDREIVEALRNGGHDVLYIAEILPSISDDEVLRQASTRGALLLTADKDFGELIFRQNRVHAGVLLLRLAGLPQLAKVETVIRILQEHQDKLPRAFSVASPGIIRIRQSSAD